MAVHVSEQSTILVIASDPDGDPLTYNWSATCGTLSGTTGAQDKTWSAPTTVPLSGLCTVAITVTDPSGASASARVDIQVLPPPVRNSPPTITSLIANPLSVPVGGQSTSSVQASDPDGDPLTYNWSATCGTLSGQTGPGDKTWTAPNAPGTCTVSVTVTDPSGASAGKSVSIEVTAPPEPGPVQYLPLVTGNPGILGDGVVIGGSTGNTFPAGFFFEIHPRFSVATITNGLTVSAFPPADVSAGNLDLQVNFSAVGPSQECFVGSCCTQELTPTVHGVQGVARSISQTDLLSLLNIVRNNPACANVTLNDFFLHSVILYDRSNARALVRQLDALAVGIGEHVFPDDTTPPSPEIVQGFDFALDSLQVVGNISGGFFDDFNDGSLTTFPTSELACFGTVHDESGGFLHLRSSDGANTFTPGFLVDNCQLGSQSASTPLRDGAGNAVITASFRADVPLPGQGYGLQLFTSGIVLGTNEIIGIAVSDCGFAGPCVSGSIVLTGFHQTVPVNLSGVARILLRLTLDDNTNHVTPSFSTDGELTFTDIPLPASATVFTGSNQAAVSVFGSVVVPLTMNDDFNDNVLDPTRWESYVDPAPSAGTVAETNQRLEVTLNGGAVNAGIRSRCSVAGDFDVQVDFSLLNWPSNNRQGFSLEAEDLGQGQFGLFRVERFNEVGGDAYHMVFPNQAGDPTFPTTDTAGKLRLVRIGTTLSGYYHNGTNFVFINSAPVPTNPTRIVLNGGLFRSDATPASFAFDNFKVNAGTITCP